MSKREGNKTGVPDFFLNSKAFMDSMGRLGVYSDDESVRDAALREMWVKQAICGSTGALNDLWSSVKAGKFQDSDYQLVKTLYKGQGDEVTLSNGVKYSKTDLLMGRD